MGIDETKRYHQNVERYDWIADPRFLSRIYHQRRMNDTQRTVRRFWHDGIVLDVGTGTGLILDTLRGTPCVGIDLNWWAVRRAMRHCPSAGLLQGDAEDLPIRDSSCSLVICTEVLEHSARPWRIVSEIARVLRPEGVLVGSVPSKNPVWHLRRFLSSRGADVEPAHLNYGRQSLLSVLEPLDILEIRLRAYGLVLMFVAQKPAVAE